MESHIPKLREMSKSLLERSQREKDLFNQMMQSIADEIVSIIGCHQSVVSFRPHDPGSSHYVEINGVHLSEKYAEYKDYVEPPNGKGIYAMVCEGNVSLRLTQKNLENHLRWNNGDGEFDNPKGPVKHPPLVGLLATPMVNKDSRNLGVIMLSDKFEGDFTEEDERILLGFSKIASTAFEMAFNIENLYK